jgi:hypothetical protein
MLNMSPHVCLIEIFTFIYNGVFIRFFKANITWFGLMFPNSYGDLYSNLRFKIIPIVVLSSDMCGNMDCVLFTLASTFIILPQILY